MPDMNLREDVACVCDSCGEDFVAGHICLERRTQVEKDRDHYRAALELILNIHDNMPAPVSEHAKLRRIGVVTREALRP